MTAPRRYVVPAGALLLPQPLAPAVAELVRTSARLLRRGEYGRPDPDLLAWLEDLEAVADEVRRSKLAPHRVVSDEESEPAGPKLLSTAEAAARLGVDPSTLRRSPLPRRKVAGQLWWPADEVEAERSARDAAA